MRIALLGVVVCAGLCFAAPAPLAAAAPGVAPGTVELTLAPGGRSMVPTNLTTPTVVPDPEIVFLADTTGSMDPALANVRNALPAIMTKISAAAPTARFAVAEYKEQRDGARVFGVNTALTADRTQVLTGAQQWLLGVGGGGSPQTDFLNAHFRLASGAVKWRPQGSRVIAWFGDARSNDPSVGHTLAATTSALAGAHTKVVAVPITGTSAPGLDERGQATAITQATGGVLMPGRAPNQVADAILAGIQSLPVTVTPRATCDPALTVVTFQKTSTVRSGTAAAFRENIGARPDAVPGHYRCTVDFQLDGRSVGNSQTVIVHVPSARPTVRINDVTVDEGDSGSDADPSQATLTVSLDTFGTAPVSVDWSTVAGTAGTYDFTPASGTVTFAPGESSKQVSVRITGDRTDEPDEAFTVHLATPTNGVLGDADGTVTIRDDDKPLPELRINDASGTEVDYYNSSATLTVSLTPAGTEPVTVVWATIAGTASPSDYVYANGTLTFEPGDTSEEITVLLRGDTIDEANETFAVRLSSAQGATIADEDGTVTIIDNDSTIG